MEFKVTQVHDYLIRIEEYKLDTMYLVIGNNYNVLIDTGTGVGKVKDLVDKLSDKPYKVIATHGHVDHIGGMHQFDDIYIHPQDNELAKQTTKESRQFYANKMIAGRDNVPFTLDEIQEENKQAKLIAIQEGDIFDLGNLTLEVIHTPGHTLGSICLYCKEHQILFSGDTCQHLALLLIEELSRQENLNLWIQSILKLKNLPIQHLYGGHEYLEDDILSTLLETANLLNNHTLQPIHDTYNIFTGYMVAYKNIHIILNIEF